MDPDAVLSLFDAFWFNPEIFRQQSQTLFSHKPNPHSQPADSSPKLRRTHTRSKSEDFTSTDSEIIKPSLQTILSDKEFFPKTPIFNKPQKGGLNKKKALSKSLSELEFEELKGFMDLGFVFSEEDRESSLAEIIPGLHRLGQRADSDGDHKEGTTNGGELSEGTRITRPYLSEAWQDLDEQEEDKYPLMKWRIPEVKSEIDMKDSLKWWAHSVASAVR